MKNKRVWRILLVVVVLPVALLGAFRFMSQKPENLGVVDGKLAPCPDSPNCVSSQADDPSQKMEAISYTTNSAAAMQALKASLQELPRTKVVTETENYLHAESRSLIFRFVDDIEFYIDEADQLIHFRSASRVGRSDLGVNRQRMERIKKLFQQNAATP